MSTDLSVPDVVATTENSSSKRSLGGKCKNREGVVQNLGSENCTINGILNEENQPKRIKVETVSKESSIDRANQMMPIETPDSVPSMKVETVVGKSSLSISANHKEKNDKGDNKTLVMNSSTTTTTTTTTSTTSTTDAGLEVDVSQKGGNRKPLHVPSPAVTRSRSISTDNKRSKEDVNGDSSQIQSESSTSRAEPKARWRVHQMAEDYTNLVGSMMYPATEFQSYGYNPEERQYPLEKISLLGFIKSPFRRPTILEKWSPYEIALFEGSILHYGKEFHNISRQIRTKTTQEVIDFYYIWKKTAHYKKWKQQYVSDEDLIDDYHIAMKKPKR